MEIVNNFFSNLKNGFFIIRESLNFSNLLIGILTFTAFSILLLLIIARLKRKTIKSKYRIIRDKERLLIKIVNIIEKFGIGKRILNNITFKICVYNRSSIDKNKEYSVIVLLGTMVFSILMLTIVIPNTNIVWYLNLIYFGIFLGLLYLTLYVFNIMAKRSFSNKMPNTFRLINDRLIYTENILKALEISRIDFDKPVKREIDRIYASLTKNTKSMADNTFKFLENIYGNEHFTILLNLIYQGHYKGVTEELKKQFENTTEEILIELENQRDISLNSRMYIFLTLSFVFFIGAIEKFNIKALGTKAMLYYNSPRGIVFKIIILSTIVIHISVLLIMERNS